MLALTHCSTEADSTSLTGANDAGSRNQGPRDQGFTDLGPKKGLASDPLLFVPTEIDFGTIAAGCESRQRIVTLINVSASALILEAFEARPGFRVFFASKVPRLPAVLAPGEQVQLEVGFRPDVVSDYVGHFDLRYSAGRSWTRTLKVNGSAGYGPPQEERFDIPGPPEVDILLVIDDTPSMQDNQAAVAANLWSFYQFLKAQWLDFHLGVITTDGRGVLRATTEGTRFLTSESPSGVFSELVRVGISGAEPALSSASARAALSEPTLSSANRGFVRNEAVLSAIFISDGPDRSPGEIDDDLRFFFSIKGVRNPHRLVLSAITAPAQPGFCDGPGGSAETDARLAEMAVRTGGIFQSLCTPDWSRSLESTSTNAHPGVPRRRLFLTNQPVISTIEVFVDDTLFEPTASDGQTQWRYDFSTNSITFSPWAYPEPRSVVRVVYVGECR